MHYNNYNMNQVVLFNNFPSNPSYLGADKLWTDFGSDELVGDIIALKDYDGI